MFAVICPVRLKLDLQNAAELRSTWLAGLHLRPLNANSEIKFLNKDHAPLPRFNLGKTNVGYLFINTAVGHVLNC